MQIPNTNAFPVYVNETIGEFEHILISSEYRVLERLMRITRGEIFVLKVLWKSSSPVSPTYLSDVMRSSKGRISAILNSLEKKGEIERTIDRDNRRNILVTLTDSGRDHILRELLDAYQVMARALEQMGEADSRELARLLHQFLAGMDFQDEKKGAGSYE